MAEVSGVELGLKGQGRGWEQSDYWVPYKAIPELGGHSPMAWSCVPDQCE